MRIILIFFVMFPTIHCCIEKVNVRNASLQTDSVISHARQRSKQQCHLQRLFVLNQIYFNKHLSICVNMFVIRQRKCANDELISYYQVEAPIHRPSFYLFFSLTIKDKTNISLTIKILHLGQGSFTRKVRTIFTLRLS